MARYTEAELNDLKQSVDPQVWAQLVTGLEGVTRAAGPSSIESNR